MDRDLLTFYGGLHITGGTAAAQPAVAAIEGREVPYLEITNNVHARNGKLVFFMMGLIHGNAVRGSTTAVAAAPNQLRAASSAGAPMPLRSAAVVRGAGHPCRGYRNKVGLIWDGGLRSRLACS